MNEQYRERHALGVNPRAIPGGFLLLALVACSSSMSPEQLPKAPSTTRQLLLGEGDIIEVRVFREPELTGTYRVSPAGSIDFPFIGQVEVLRRSAEEVATEIRARLADGYIKNPQVVVFVKEHNSLKIFVLGQVNKPGSFPYEIGMTVIQAVARAGGFTALATSNVNVTRVVGTKEQRIDVPVGEIQAGRSPNFELQPGDIVFVPESLF